jgi:phosphate transport system substrate-binding protein
MNLSVQPGKRMGQRAGTSLLATVLAAFAGIHGAGPVAAAERLTQVRMSIDEDPIVLRLASSLGYLKQEGISIAPVDLEKISKADYLMQEPLTRGQIDASYHWFNHTVFGARHRLAVKAVMMINDAPGMTVLVANRVKDRIRSAADFRGIHVADGAQYGTKAVITGYLARKAGVAPQSFTPVMVKSEGRLDAVLQGLKDGTVDVMTFQEPMTSALLESNMVSRLYDLNSAQTTTAALGAAFPAQSLLMSPQYIETHPNTVQHLVNALVKAMRFVNSHTAEQIAEQLPPDYFDGKDRLAQVKLIRNTLPTYAKGDYSFSAAAVQLVVDAIKASDFDSSEEGRWRATGDNSNVEVSQLYDNRFVLKAMKAVPAAIPHSAGSAAEPLGFDLAGLPLYQWVPSQEDRVANHCHGAVCEGVWGVIRIHGTELTQHLVHLWQDNFLKLHPNIRFGDYFVPNGFGGLIADTADLNVMGHTAWRSDLKAFEEVYGYPPLEIMFATGAFNRGKGNSPGVVFFVNRDNPISRLSLKQLDGIFGAERTGGWKGTTWSTEAARAADDNIRTWGQLGLAGEWADQPIRIYGLDATLSNWSDLIQQVVFDGGDKWNPAIKEMVRGGSKAPSDAQIVSSVANDRYGIGFNLMRVVEKERKVKPLAIATAEAGPYIAPTEETMYRRTYPLSNAVYIYINRGPGEPISPRLKEFLTYILSRQGQQDVVDDGLFLPLNPQAAGEQREKLR